MMRKFIEFTAQTRMSGVDQGRRQIRKGCRQIALSSSLNPMAEPFRQTCNRSSSASVVEGGTPLVVAENERVVGVIQLKDIVKGGYEGALRTICAKWGSRR